MFGMGESIKYIVILVVVVVIVAAFWYVSGLKADLAISEENNSKLEGAVSTQQEVIDGMKTDQEQIKGINERLSSVIESQRQDVNALRDRFEQSANGQKRDFGKTAAANPEKVQEAVNRGTMNALRCLEIASGSPLTEAETNAKKYDQINRECPSLANPNYVPAAGN